MTNLRRKQAKDENFPVASFLIKKELRPLIQDYYNLARFADDIADNPLLLPQEKLSQLSELEDVFLGLKEPKDKKGQAARILHDDFVKEKLDFSLVTDLFCAFRRDSENALCQTWAQLIDYCRYSAVPVGRFMLAVHDENPATYLPAATLCTVLQIVNHLQDIKYDYTSLKRIYLPKDLMLEFKIEPQELGLNKETAELRALIVFICEQLQALLLESSLLVKILNSFRLKAEICVIISLTNIMIKKILKGDVLEKDIKLSAWDKLLGLLRGIGKALVTRRKTLPGKGL